MTTGTAVQQTGTATPQPPATATATARELQSQIEQQVNDAVRAGEAAANAGSGSTQRVREITFPNGSKITIDRNNNVNVSGDVGSMMDFRKAVPTGAVDIVQSLSAALVLCVVGFPLARAFARRLDRRTAAPALPPEVMSRLMNIENAVESVAVEVERISEGQRFTAKLLSDRADAVPIGSRT